MCKSGPAYTQAYLWKRVMEKDNHTKLMHCSSCGAEYDRNLVHCPYCGATNPEAAENEYMDSLRNIRHDLNDLKSLAKKETTAEAREAGRFIRKVLALILVIMAIGAGYTAYYAYHEERRDEKEYLWMRDNIARLDSYYENRQYDELLRFYNDAVEEDEDVPVWTWRHYQVFYYLELADRLGQIISEEKQGFVPDEDDRAWILVQELELLYASEYSHLPEEDAAWIAEFARPYLNDLQERFFLSKEEKDRFMQLAEEADGYLDYEQCCEFLKARCRN